MKPQPTANQITALSLFATLNGRRWKECLRTAWCTGDYARFGCSGLSGYLQQVRNQFGPSWLIRYKLPKTDPLAEAQAQVLTQVEVLEAAIKKATSK
jgi:hypothetical protein